MSVNRADAGGAGTGAAGVQCGENVDSSRRKTRQCCGWKRKKERIVNRDEEGVCED